MKETQPPLVPNHPLQEWDWWIADLPDLIWPAVGLGLFDPLGARARCWNRWEKLLRSLERRRHPSALDAARRGRLRRLMGEGGARADLEAALRRAPRHPSVLTWNAELALECEPRRALELLKVPTGFAASLNRGAAQMRLKNHEKAAACFKEAASQGSHSAALAELLQAAANLRLARHTLAAAALKAAEDAGFSGAALHWLRAFALKGMGRHAQALRSVERAFHFFSELSADPLLGVPLRRESRLEELPGAGALAALKGKLTGPYRVLAAVRRAEDQRSPGLSRYRDAVALLKQASRWAPRSPWVSAYLGRGLESLGESAAAGAALRRANTLDPGCGWITAWRGHWLMRHERPSAIAVLRRAASACSDYPFARAWLGGALRRAGRWEEAGAELEASLRMEPGYEWSSYELFEVRRRQSRWVEAARHVTRAFERDRKFTWAKREDRASLLSALADLDAAVRSTPQDALLRAWRAWVLLGLEEYSRARSELSQIADGAPAFVYYVWSEYWQSQGRLDLSERSLGSAGSLRRVPVYIGARGVERYLLGRLRGAREDLEKSVSLDGTSARFHCALGATLVEMGKPARAVAALDRALRLDGRYTQALAHRARAWLMLGRQRRARRDIALSRSINRECPWTALAAWPLERTALGACTELLKAVAEGSALPPRLLSRARKDLRRAALRAKAELRP